MTGLWRVAWLQRSVCTPEVTDFLLRRRRTPRRKMTMRFSNCFLTQVSFAALGPAPAIPRASADFARNYGTSLLQRRATQRSKEWTSANRNRIARFVLYALAVAFATS